jgi:uncharacterized OB-fold protein
MHRPFPLPDTDWPLLAEYWAGAAAGELRLPRCGACRAWRWYPRERCEACGSSQDPVWQRLQGRGRLFSWAVVHRAFLPAFADQVPFVTGLVALAEDEHLRIPTRIVDCDAAALTADMEVEVVFRPLPFGDPADPVLAPFFRPVETRPR